MSKLNNISVDGTVYNIDDFHVIKNNSYNNPFIITEHEPGIYIVDSSEAKRLPGKLYAKYIDSEDYDVRTEYYNGFLCLTDTSIDDPYTYKNIGYIFDASAGLAYPCVTQPAPWGFSLTGASSGIGNSAVKTIGNQTVSGKKTFSTLPESSVVPTTNNQLVNKKYVDELGVKVGTTVDNNYRTNILYNKNLLYEVTLTNEYRLNVTGGLIDETGWSTTDYIEVEENTEYIINITRTSEFHRICFYNNSKVFLSKDETVNATFTTPANTKYIRFSSYTADFSGGILQKGSLFTIPSIVVDNETIYTKGQDGIIESGSNANGNYIKFADGTLICTIRKTINIAINTAWGSLYVGSINTKYTYPIAFVGNDPVVNYSITGYNSAFVMSWTQSSDRLVETDSFALVRGNPASEQNYVLNITAIGKWK